MNDVIARTRPTDESLRAEWTPGTFVPSAKRRVARPFPRRLLAAAAILVAALAVGVSAILPSWSPTPAVAAPLEQLALKAAGQPAPQWADTQFLHVRTVSRQDDNQPVHSVATRDDWYAPDGWVWSHRESASGSGSHVEEFIFAPADGWMRPGFAATMPTDPHELDAFLRARVTGSTSQDEAVFVAIGDMLRQEAAPPALRAAALRTLGLNPKATVTKGQDPTGRPCLVVTFVDEGQRPGERQVLFLDEGTGDLLGDAIYGPGFVYESTVTLRVVVDALPADIAERLGTEKVVKDGNAKPDPYTGPNDPTPVPSQTYSPPIDPSTAPSGGVATASAAR